MASVDWPLFRAPDNSVPFIENCVAVEKGISDGLVVIFNYPSAECGRNPSITVRSMALRHCLVVLNHL